MNFISKIQLKESFKRHIEQLYREVGKDKADYEILWLFERLYKAAKKRRLERSDRETDLETYYDFYGELAKLYSKYLIIEKEYGKDNEDLINSIEETIKLIKDLRRWIKGYIDLGEKNIQVLVDDNDYLEAEVRKEELNKSFEVLRTQEREKIYSILQKKYGFTKVLAKKWLEKWEDKIWEKYYGSLNLDIMYELWEKCRTNY